MRVPFHSRAQGLRAVRSSSIVIGCAALAFTLACPTEPPGEDAGVDAGVDPKYDGGEPLDDGGEPNPNCGNGVVEPPEQCDDGNNIQTDGCKNNCTYNVCGDGYVYQGVEECDDGNTTNGDGCSAACLYEPPPLPDYVTLTGQVKNRKYADGSGYSQYVSVRALGAQLCVDTANPGQYKACTAGGPTGPDGAYTINYVQPQSTFYVDLRIDTVANRPPDQPGPWAVRLKGYTKDQPTETLNPYYIPFDWMQQVADACGVYTAENFTGENPELVQRTIIFGQLKNRATGQGVAGVTKNQISVRIGDYVNNNPNYVCFLNVDPNTNYLVGTQSNTSYAESGGAFVVFKLVNQQGGTLGNGNAYVNAGPTFEEASISLNAGNVGVVTLYTNDNEPPIDLVDFTTQVYPLFTTLGCVSCHYENGPGGVNNNNGYYAIYGGPNVTPEDVYNNLVGPGTNCTVTNYVGNYRVCLNDPPASRLLTRPLLEDPPDGHPNASFADEYDPNYLLVKAWIEQGAVFNAIPPEPPENVYTLYGVMDIAAQRGCTACHGYNLDYGGTGRPAGNLALDGCEQYYIDNGTYANNNIDYNSATNPYYKRDCVYYHLRQANIANDPYGYNYRVNPNYPERSMLLRNPYCGPYYCADDPQYPETHPVKVFANTDDPGYVNILSWIEDGAQNNGSPDQLYIQQ